MSKRLCALGFCLLIATVFVTVACTSPGTGLSMFTSPITTPPVITSQDVQFTFEFSSPAVLNRPIPITITVISAVDIPDAAVTLTILGPSVDRNDPPQSLGNLKSTEPKQLTTDFTLPEEATYFVMVHLFSPIGFHTGDSRNIKMIEGEIIVNPTDAYGPGTPAPAAPSEPLITPRPTSTTSFPEATPTPSENGGLPESRNIQDTTAAASTVTLRGHVWIEDRDHVVRPGKYMRVQVWDWMNPTPTADRLLGTTTTDASGDWVLGPVTNSDPDGTRLDIYYTFETATYSDAVPPLPLRIVVRQSGFAYAWTTRDFPTWDVPDGDQWVNGGGVNWSTSWYRGVWLFSDMNRAWEYVTGMSGSEPGGVVIRWEPGVNSWGQCSSACYLPILSPNGVFIPDQDSYTPDTVIHEIGHRYRHNLLGMWFFTDIPAYLSCTQHYIFGLMPNQRCAWSEAWADYFALVVNSQVNANDWCYDYRGLGPCSVGSDDLENQGWWDVMVPSGIVGDYVEGRIAGALWDITDHHNDVWDTRGDSFWAVWTLMRESPLYTAQEFYNTWMNRWGNQVSIACRYYNNTIDYGECSIYRFWLPLSLNE